MGSAQARDNRNRTSRPRRRETHPEPLPAYEPRAASQLVRPTDVSYNTPAAFELAEEIAINQRTSVAPSMAAAGAVSYHGQLPLIKRMTEVQRALDELNKLTAETPAEGYPPHSIQALKIVQLKQDIALMSDPESERVHHPEGHLSIHDPSRSPLPEPVTLHARMAAVQRLLAEADRVMGQPASLETSIQLQSLRTRLSELAECDSTPGPTLSSTRLAIPDPVHFATTGLSAGNLEPDTLVGAGQSEVWGGGSEVPSGSSAVPGPRELPPPYKAVIRDPADDCAEPGATSMR